MKLVSVISGAVLAASLAGAAAADQVYASDPQSVVNFFFDQSVPAQLTVDSYGDPMVEYRYNGEEYVLFFYDCDANTNCQALQFWTGHHTDGSVGLDTINSWNADSRYVFAYIDDENDTQVELDIYTGYGGISGEDFSWYFNHWIDSVAAFESLIGW